MPPEPVYIIDTHAVLQFNMLGFSDEDLASILIGMTGLVEKNILTFPSCVVKDCEKYAPTDTIYVWLHAVAAARKIKAAPYSCQERVLGICRDLLDDDDPDGTTPVEVAALALNLKESGANVFVVTEDRSELPTRMSLHAGCAILDIATLDVSAFINQQSLMP